MQESPEFGGPPALPLLFF